MRMHYLQHVQFEGVAAIGDWASVRGLSVSRTLMFDSPRLPDPANLDLLVVMGGPMNIYEHDVYPWLQTEKAFIAATIEAGKAVLGICLGAQLTADVLGGPVVRGDHVEIGWFPVALTPGSSSAVFARFPAEFTALHYHGDTFAIPPGAVRAASSAACVNQAFSYAGGRVVGLQFHIEVTLDSMKVLVEHAPPPAPSKDEPWIQSPEELLAPGAPYDACRELLFGLLDGMMQTVS